MKIKRKRRMTFQFFRRPVFRAIAVFLAINLLLQTVWPTAVWALTSGPSQPEVQSFEPVGTSEMVDLFSGDFTYNIPLFEVEGYPINLAYHSGISMDQEASWVGLGWNINPGSILRNFRGIPDDFSGEKIVEETNIKESVTWGVNANFGLELAGWELNGGGGKGNGNGALGLDIGLGVKKNNYVGLSANFSLSPSYAIQDANKLTKAEYGLSIKADGSEGLSITPSISLNDIIKKRSQSSRLSTTINSRSGLSDISLSYRALHYRYLEGAATMSFANPSYFPSSPNSFKTNSYSLSGKIGAEAKWLFPSAGISGFYNIQKLKNKKIKAKAYGYNNLGRYLDLDKKDQQEVLLDFNREKNVPFTKNRPNLSLSTLTYDSYSISGQGIGGVIRPYRNDIGYVFDPKHTSRSSSPSGGVEYGVGDLAKWGGNLGYIYSHSVSKHWNSLNEADDFLKFNGSSAMNIEEKAKYEEVYFKNAAERTIPRNSFYENYGKDKPIEVDINWLPLYMVQANSKFQSEEYDASGNRKVEKYNIQDNIETSRVARNQLITQLTAEEAGLHSIQKNLEFYDKIHNPVVFCPPEGCYGAFDFNRWGNSNSNEAFRKKYHTGEVTVHKPDGWRYIYSLPAYNIKHEEYTFAIDEVNNGSCSTGLVNYTDNEASVDNKKGIDNYFNKKSIPPYAHSYLLTGVVSPDYIDIDQDGITDDDYGSAVQFKYLRKTNSYNWRTPYGLQSRQGNYQEGLKSDPRDDKASFNYGQKEVWYLKEIVSENQIAIFYLSNRLDGLGVKNFKGGKDISDANRLMKIDSIKLYSKIDYEENQATATPLKSVHLEYDYSLCPNVQNFDDPSGNTSPGKLTLKKVYFTYGTSKKAKLNGYEFHYADMDHDGEMDYVNGKFPFNPSYNLRGYDRWGNYKPNTENCDIVSGELSNVDFPYVSQKKIPENDPLYSVDKPNQTYTDIYAGAWNLSKIDLPSGGSINVHYESDDYGYVQDKKAMQMFKLSGFNTSASLNGMTSDLYNEEEEHMNYVIFKLDNEIDPSEYTAIKKNLFNSILKYQRKNVFFKTLVKMTDEGFARPDGSRPPAYEYVQGYFQVDADEVDDSNIGFLSDNQGGSYTHGFLKVKMVHVSGNNWSKLINPITKAGLQFARNQLTALTNPGSEPEATSETAIKGLLSAFTEVASMIIGHNKMLINKEFCKSIIPQKSFIRLGHPTLSKKGGGSRVAKVEFSDNWAKMIGSSHGDNSTYGQTYDYTLTKNGRKISSGVAQYEPQIGGEENPFRQPIYYTEKALLAPNTENYVEGPMGESLFPGANVGYRKVTVKSLSNANVTSRAMGRTENEFFTAYDFPVFVDETDLDPIVQRNNPILSFLLNDRTRALAASQGYSIELNDMHGKPKSTTSYGEGNESIVSRVEYQYKTKPDNAKKLDNEVKVISKEGVISDNILGREMELINDFQWSRNVTFGLNVQFNIDGSLLGLIPLPIFTTWPAVTFGYDRFASASTTKVIYRKGILDKTIAWDFSSKINTSNELYDAETGNPVLTKTTNEFEEPIYNFNYPAYWAHDAMGGGYANVGSVHGPVNVSNGYATFSQYSDISEHFIKGDEIIVYNSDNSISEEKLWVVGVDEANKKVLLIDKTGNFSSNLQDVTLKNIRSGRRNMQDMSVGGFTSISNPEKEQSINSIDSVINASSTDYSDNWQVECDCYCQESIESDTTFNQEYACTIDTCFSSCEENQILTSSFIQLFNELADSGDLTSSNVVVGDVGQYEVYNDAMRDYVEPMADQHVWNLAGYTRNTLTGNFRSINYDEDYRYDQCPVSFSMELRDLPEACSKEEIWNGLQYIDYPVEYENPYEGSEDCPDEIEVNDIIATAYFRVECPDLYEFSTDLHIETTCYPFFNCTGEHIYEEIYRDIAIINNDTVVVCSDGKGNLINPYLSGREGIWRQKSNYVFNESRVYNDYTRYEGLLNDYEQFWTWNSGKLSPSNSTKWINQNEVTKVHPEGFEVENKDPLGNYSCAIFGYDHTLPVAVASNARYNEVGYDGFEDYDFTMSNECSEDHFSFRQELQNLSNKAHTGYNSIVIQPNEENSMTRNLNPDLCEPSEIQISDYPYETKDCDCLGVFGPSSDGLTENDRYLISYWVSTNSMPEDFIIDQAEIEIRIDGTPIQVSEYNRTKVVEGWQRIEEEFTIPSGNYDKIDIVLKNNGSTSSAIYFDDVRVHPFNSSIKTYVYDPISLRLKAELDENNFATFYEYNQEGKLIRVKKETAGGIVTIQETRENLHKSQ